MKTFFSLLALFIASASAQDIISIHGSGTTNPSRCYWAIMREFTVRSKLPIRMTYRAIGSSNGQREFVNDVIPANHFGSGDIPMTGERFQALADLNAGGMMHLPVFTGAVSFFHNVPGAHRLNLTGELLARIYSFDIENWKDELIMNINPNLDLGDYDDDETVIYMGRRISGSSSTSAAVGFMNDVAPGLWTATGSSPDWPNATEAGVDDRVMMCAGSGGMTDCIRNTEFSIGYIDAGHGLGENLPEVRIQNAQGIFLSVAESLARGGFETAEEGALPEDPSSTFEDVSFINRPGEYTWPMVSLTYIYVRKDLSFLSDDQKGLLIVFLKALYMSFYNNKCVLDYGFLLPAPAIRDFALDAIEELENANPVPNRWGFEEDTQVIAGQGDYVISHKRESADFTVDEIELKDALSDVDQKAVDANVAIGDLEVEIDNLQRQLDMKTKNITDLQAKISVLEAGGVDTTANQAADAVVADASFSSKDESRLQAALVMSMLSFILSIIVGGIALTKRG